VARIIAKRLRAIIFLFFVIVGVPGAWQSGLRLSDTALSLGIIYAVLYGIPPLVGKLWRLLARLRRRTLSRRRIRRMLSAVRHHLFGERWARQSFDLQIARGIIGLLLFVLIVPYVVGSLRALAYQRYDVLGTVTSQGDAHAILAVYGGKVFVADVQRGVARAVIVEELADIDNVEVRSEDVGWVAWDLCKQNPDPVDRAVCYFTGPG